MADIPYTKEMIKIPTGFGYGEAIQSGHGGADREMMKAFINSILRDEKSPIDLDLGIKMSLPGIYAHMSTMQGGMPIEIPKWRF